MNSPGIDIIQESWATNHAIHHVATAKRQNAQEWAPIGTGHAQKGVHQAGQWGAKVFARVNTNTAHDCLKSLLDNFVRKIINIFWI